MTALKLEADTMAWLTRAEQRLEAAGIANARHEPLGVLIGVLPCQQLLDLSGFDSTWVVRFGVYGRCWRKRGTPASCLLWFLIGAASGCADLGFMAW